MRLILAFLAVLLSVPAFAADWTSYENPRFGYELLIPPDYGPHGPPPENGDGQVFIRDDGTQLLRVYGGNLVDRDFRDAVGLAMDAATERGWSLSYKRVTQRWASYSGTRDGMILYARAITLCRGTQFASFEIEYPASDLDAMHSVIERMVPSLKATGDGLDC